MDALLDVVDVDVLVVVVVRIRRHDGVNVAVSVAFVLDIAHIVPARKRLIWISSDFKIYSVLVRDSASSIRGLIIFFS